MRHLDARAGSPPPRRRRAPKSAPVAGGESGGELPGGAGGSRGGRDLADDGERELADDHAGLRLSDDDRHDRLKPRRRRVSVVAVATWIWRRPLVMGAALSHGGGGRYRQSPTQAAGRPYGLAGVCTGGAAHPPSAVCHTLRSRPASLGAGPEHVRRTGERRIEGGPRAGGGTRGAFSSHSDTKAPRARRLGIAPLPYPAAVDVRRRCGAGRGGGGITPPVGRAAGGPARRAARRPAPAAPRRPPPSRRRCCAG
jgi:hypothetical protein